MMRSRGRRRTCKLFGLTQGGVCLAEEALAALSAAEDSLQAPRGLRRPLLRRATRHRGACAGTHGGRWRRGRRGRRRGLRVTQTNSSPEPAPLAGRVCIVAGASRGVGRGIAMGLGEAGATVICVARSTRFGIATEGRRETVEDTAEAVEEAGGPRPSLCLRPHRHAGAARVLRLGAAPLRPAQPASPARSGAATKATTAIAYADGAALRHAVSSALAVGLEIALGSGAYALMATARAFAPAHDPGADGAAGGVGFDARGPLLGDPSGTTSARRRAAAPRSSWRARHRRPSGLDGIHLTPGFVRTERVLAAGLGGEATESPLYAGRAVAALAADPRGSCVERRARCSSPTWRASYGFTDADGTQPPRFVPPD